MAFNLKKFAKQSAGATFSSVAGNSSDLWRLVTEDSDVVVQGAGYFNAARLMLTVGDQIVVITDVGPPTTSEATYYLVESVDAGSDVTVARQAALDASDINENLSLNNGRPTLETVAFISYGLGALNLPIVYNVAFEITEISLLNNGIAGLNATNIELTKNGTVDIVSSIAVPLPADLYTQAPSIASAFKSIAVGDSLRINYPGFPITDVANGVIRIVGRRLA